ncbi:MAG: FAD-binding oxidoreductase [Candidatus Njordarchaeia archaeon]
MEIVKDLKKIIGPENVETDPAVIRLYSKEASGLESSALAVVFPQNTEQISELVRFAYKNDIKLYPQGSASTLTGSALPEENGVIISFSKMNKILEYSLVDGFVVCQPGVRLVDLNEFLAKDGYMFPVDPTSQTVATVGGEISTGGGGLRGAKYGTMRDWVMALEVVLPDEKGTVIRVGCKTAKCRQGYDLVRLFVGSEGTLGIVTEATLKIAPMPENTVFLGAFFDTLDEAMVAIENIRRTRLEIAIMELVEQKSVANGLTMLNVDWGIAKHYLVVGVEGPKEATDRYLDLLENAVRSAGAVKVIKARDMDEAAKLKILALRGFSLAFTKHTVDKVYSSEPGEVKRVEMGEDIGVPPSKLGVLFKKLRELEDKYGLPMTLAAHVLEGCVHPTIWVNTKDKEEVRKAEEFFDEIIRVALELDGTVSAEHGIGILKKREFVMEFEKLGSTKPLELMKSIKRLFDPKGILNPGKIF